MKETQVCSFIHQRGSDICLTPLLDAQTFVTCISLDVDKSGSLATILFAGELMQYIEGEDKRLEHHLENATLTRGLVNCKKRSTNGKEKHADPIVDSRAGLNGRPEYVHAILHSSYFQSSGCTDNWQLRIRIKERGIEEKEAKDAVGHIVGHQLGGLFQEGYLYPQNPSLNQGHWKVQENYLKKWLDCSGKTYL